MCCDNLRLEVQANGLKQNLSQNGIIALKNFVLIAKNVFSELVTF